MQSNVLTENTVKKVMPSCMIHAFVQSMTFMVDVIIASHYLGSSAVAGVALGIPIIALMLSFAGMILHGGFLKMLGVMGKSDMEDYRRFYSISLCLTIIVDLIFMAFCIFGTDIVLQIAGAAKATEQAVTLGRLYIRTACLMIVFFSMGSQFQIVMDTYGYQTDRMICSVICVVVNIASSLVFIHIKAFRDKGKIEIILRNYDHPYNPLVFERAEESFAKIGVTMVQKIAKDITYSYSYHLNVVSVIIEA